MSHLYMSLLGCLLIPLGSAHICRTCLEIVSNLFAHFRSMLVLMMCKPHISQVSISLIDPLQKGLRGCLERQECHKKLCAACSFGWNDAMTIMIITLQTNCPWRKACFVKENFTSNKMSAECFIIPHTNRNKAREALVWVTEHNKNTSAPLSLAAGVILKSTVL